MPSFEFVTTQRISKNAAQRHLMIGCRKGGGTQDNRSILWVDAGGGSTITLVRSTAGAAGIQTQLLAVSNADWFNWWEGPVNINGAPAPTAAPNQSVNTQATLVFLCNDGTQVKLALPSPKASIFLADGVTVNAASIAALIAACNGTLVSQSGGVAASYLAGLLTERRNP